MDMMGKPASFLKRFCSIFIDLVLVAIVYVVFATITTQVANKVVQYDSLISEANQYVEQYYEMGVEAGIIIQDKDDPDLFVYVEGLDDESTEVIEFKNSQQVKDLEMKYGEVKNRIDIIETVKFSIDILLAELPFFLIVPLCRKDGATIGKIIMKLSVVTRNDCKVKRIQTTFRFFVLYLLETLFFYYFFGVMAILFLPIFELAFWCFTKHKLFIHDLLCLTKVVETSFSIIFEDNNEREEYYRQKEIQDREYAALREKNRKSGINMEGYND